MLLATLPPNHHHHHIKKMTTDSTSHSVPSVRGDTHDDTQGSNDSGQEDGRRYSINSQSSYALSTADEDCDSNFAPEDDEDRKAEWESVKNFKPLTDEELKLMSPEERKLVAPYLSEATATTTPNRADPYLNRSTSTSEGGVMSIDWAARKTEGDWSAAAGSSNQNHEFRGQRHFGTGKGSFGVDSDRENGNGGSIFSEVKW